MTLAVKTAVLHRQPTRRDAGGLQGLVSTRRTVAFVSLVGLVEAVWIVLLFELVRRVV